METTKSAKEGKVIKLPLMILNIFQLLDLGNESSSSLPPARLKKWKIVYHKVKDTLPLKLKR